MKRLFFAFIFLAFPALAQTYGPGSGAGLNGVPLGQAVVNLGMASGRTITYSGSAPHAQNNSDLWMFDYVNGTNAGQLNWNLIDVENTSSSGTALNNALLINQNFGGGTGGYSGLYVINNQVASTLNSNGYYTTGTFVAQAAHNDNGTSGAYAGHLYGLNPNCRLASGATYWDQIVCQEIDVGAYAGSSVNDKIGLQIVDLSGNSAPSPAHTSAAVVIAGATGNDGTPLFNLGVSLGTYEGVSGVKSSGTYIGCYPHANTGSCGTIAYGIDLRNRGFTGSAFASPNFAVDPSGNITSNQIQAFTTNNSLNLRGNGTGEVTIGSANSGAQVIVGSGSMTATNNTLTAYSGPAAGGYYVLSFNGSDPTVGAIIQSKGQGIDAYQFWDGNNSGLLRLHSVSSGTNGVVITQGAGASPTIATDGTGNIGLDLEASGSGVVTANHSAILTSGTSTSGGAIVSVSLGASPATYTAPARGTVVLTAGSGLTISLTRLGTKITYLSTDGAVPVAPGDVVTVVYSSVPTVNFVPQ